MPLQPSHNNYAVTKGRASLFFSVNVLTGFSLVWTFVCSILIIKPALPLIWLSLLPTLTLVLCAFADAQLTIVCCCWCPLYYCVLLLMPVYRYVLLLMPTLPLCAVADAPFTVVCCSWCPLYRCVLLLMTTLPLFAVAGALFPLLLMPTLTLWAVADAHFTVVGWIE